ncbi:MAG: glycosyltransferase [Lachnospiraceae bacterium]|nr:glycosyltransferase [Lachnospiraceae bacterium]
MKKTFSIIIPVYGNEDNIPITIPYIMERLSLFPDYNVELILVCDGSPDKSWDKMKEYQAKYPDTIIIAKFLRNFGQRAAVNYGFSIATGDVIGVISCDLQDPFELFADMLKAWESGHNLVIGYRKERAEHNMSVFFSKSLHKFINKHINSNYPIGGFDFYVVDKIIAQNFVKSDSKNNSMQLLLLELSDKPYFIGYERKERAVGHSGYHLKSKINQTLNIFSVYSVTVFDFFWFIIFLIFAVAIALIIISLIKSDSFEKGLYGLLLLSSGINMALLNYIGISQFKVLQNHNNTPRYIVTELIDQTRKED